jgi:dienelactone hydrolase
MRSCLLAFALLFPLAGLLQAQVPPTVPRAATKVETGIIALPDTHPLTWQGDLAEQLVAGADRFLLRKLDESATTRDRAWPATYETDDARAQAIAAKRARLARLLGVREARVKFAAPQLLATTAQSALVAEAESYRVFAVRWPTVGDLFAEGLLIEPKAEAIASVVILPDADHAPETQLGLIGDTPRETQYAREFAEAGYRVLVPALLSRKYEARNGRAKMTDREFIYRSAFELGRHIIGYEVQAVLAGVDWLAAESNKPVGVLGSGEGGMIALYAAALDPRIEQAAVMGYFGRKENVWQQPLDRNLFGVLNEFGDAEVAALTRGLLIGDAGYPTVNLPSEGGAPGILKTPPAEEIRAELARLKKISTEHRVTHLAADDGEGTAKALAVVFFAENTGVTKKLEDKKITGVDEVLTAKWKAFDVEARQKRLLHAMDRHNQQLLEESPYVRVEYMKGLDTTSLETFAKTSEAYRETFKRDVIGWFDDPLLPPQPRSRRIIDHAKYTGYEVVLDVWPDVFAYGILLMPKDADQSEPRPVVVCQHGLEGRPQDVVQGDHYAYHDYAAKLAERGFITFSPQNLYIGKDKFRTLQRKANPLGKTLFSIIIPQHQQIVAWLKTLPEVDDKRIAFYGLSYGGKSAMRIPPLVPEYCLSICSADFNDWVWKNASSRSPYSYVWTNEYEIFEWDLGSNFNYAEMAALIAPRPFMVERGHFDGVAPDERVALEFAKVRNLYNARLKIGERCEIEWFVGPHTINGQGTFEFLHKHLNWPE